MKEVPYTRFWPAVETANALAADLPAALFQEYCKRTDIPQFIGGYCLLERNVFRVTDEIAHRIDLMLGPHAKTVFRVWVIQVLSQEVS